MGKGRRGRPRKSGRRHPSGQIAATAVRDKGTEQVQARRGWLAGVDAAQASYPLGVLLANEAISEDEHRAGCHLAWLFAFVHGRVSIAAVSYEAGRGGGGDQRDEDRLYDCEQNLLDACTALKTISRAVYDDMLNLAVYERFPDFMRPGFPTTGQVRHAARIRAGLACLAGLRLGTGRPRLRVVRAA